MIKADHKKEGVMIMRFCRTLVRNHATCCMLVSVGEVAAHPSKPRKARDVRIDFHCFLIILLIVFSRSQDITHNRRAGPPSFFVCLCHLQFMDESDCVIVLGCVSGWEWVEGGPSFYKIQSINRIRNGVTL